MVNIKAMAFFCLIISYVFYFLIACPNGWHQLNIIYCSKRKPELVNSFLSAFKQIKYWLILIILLLSGTPL